MLISFQRSLLLATAVLSLFTSTALATTIVKPTAVALFESEFSGRNAINSINANGLDFDLITGQAAPGVYPGHSSNPNSNVWHSSGPVASTWIVYDLGANYVLSGAHIWNFNEVNLTGRDAKDITLSFSTTAPNSGFGTATPFTMLQTLGADGYQGETKLLGDYVEARYVRIDILNHYTSPTNNYTGLAEVRFLSPEAGILGETPLSGSTILVEYEPLQLTPTTNVNAITLENIGGPDTAVHITGFDLSGPDALEFDLPDFVPTILGSGEMVQFDVEFTPFVAEGAHSALLTIFTNVGSVNFNLLAVNPVPEPSSLMLLGGALLTIARRRRATRG